MNSATIAAIREILGNPSCPENVRAELMAQLTQSEFQLTRIRRELMATDPPPTPAEVAELVREMLALAGYEPWNGTGERGQLA